MYSLFIDTHSSNVVVIIFKDGLVLKKLESNTKIQTSEIVMPLIKELFSLCNILPKDLDNIIVVNGPGSFTGIRIGVVIAKTMAYTLNIPIKTITSLELITYTQDERKINVSINEVNGKFVGEYDNYNLIDVIKYFNKDDYKEYIAVNNVIEDTNFNYNKIYKVLMQKKENIPPHLVNPIYIKKLEVDKL